MTAMVTAIPRESLNLIREGCTAEIVEAAGDAATWLDLTIADLTYQLSAEDATNLAGALTSAVNGMTIGERIDQITTDYRATASVRLGHIAQTGEQA